MENDVVAPQKIKHRITMWSSYSILEFQFQNIENRNLNRYLYTHVHSIINTSQKVETTQVSIDR